MPEVKKLHQDSENVGKSKYIFGHQFGMAGIPAKGKTMQCIPTIDAIGTQRDIAEDIIEGGGDYVMT